MIDISKLSIGQKVYYKPKKENGIIKEIPSLDHVRIVYNCGGDWVNFMNYTSQLTNISDISLGWYHKKIYWIEYEEYKEVEIKCGFNTTSLVEFIENCKILNIEIIEDGNNFYCDLEQLIKYSEQFSMKNNKQHNNYLDSLNRLLKLKQRKDKFKKLNSSNEL